MASLAEDPPATLSIIRIPMIRIQLARENAIGRVFRTRTQLKLPFQFYGGGGEAAIETHHYTPLPGCYQRIQLLEFFPIQAQGFFHENIAPRSQCGLYQRTMEVMARSHEQRRVFAPAQDLLEICPR